MKSKIIEGSTIEELELKTDLFINDSPKEVCFMSFSTNSLKETTIFGLNITYSGIFHIIILYNEL